MSIPCGREAASEQAEIRKIDGILQQQGLTLIPLGLYLNEKGIAKLDIGIARGKKLYDKRDDIAKRDASEISTGLSRARIADRRRFQDPVLSKKL